MRKLSASLQSTYYGLIGVIFIQNQDTRLVKLPGMYLKSDQGSH